MADLSDSLRDAVFYGILDTGYVARENMYEKCRQLIMSGAKIVQLRAKKESEETRRELAFEMLLLFKKKNAPYFIINDSPESPPKICGIIPTPDCMSARTICPRTRRENLSAKNACSACPRTRPNRRKTPTAFPTFSTISRWVPSMPRKPNREEFRWVCNLWNTRQK